MRFKKLFAVLAGAAVAAAISCAMPCAAFAEGGVVATYNGRNYETLSSAICAARSGFDAEVKLVSDVTENVTIDSGYKVTLNLSNYTLKAADNSEPTIKVTGTANLTINSSSGGKVYRQADSITGNYDKGTVYSDQKTAILTINGGTFECTPSATGKTSGPAVHSYGTAIINGGKFIGSDDSYGAFHSEGTTEIAGGYFYSNNRIALRSNGGDVIITGGDFSAAKTGDVLYCKGGLTISGGTFNGSVCAYNDKTYAQDVDGISGSHAVVSGGLITGDLRSLLVYKDSTVPPASTSVEATGSAVVQGRIKAAIDTTYYKGSDESKQPTMTLNGGSFGNLSDVLTYMGSGKDVYKSKDGIYQLINKASEPISDPSKYPGSYKVTANDKTVYFDDKTQAEAYAKSCTPEQQVAHLRNKVTFQSFGEVIEAETKYLALGSSIEKLPEVAPVSGYTFLGWYVDGTKIADGYAPTDDVVVTAQWSYDYTYEYAKAVDVEIPALIAGDMLPTTAKAYLTREDGKTKVETAATLTWAKADGTVVEDCSDALADETYTVTALIAPSTHVDVVYYSGTAVTFNGQAAASKQIVSGGKVKATYSVTTPAISIDNAQVAVDGSSFSYTGVKIEPAVTVTLDGTQLDAEADYAVAYSDNKNVGTATITVTGTGIYKGELVAHFDIVTADVTGFKATAAKKGVKLTWDKRKAQTTGFEICWAKSKAKLAKGKVLKTVKVKKAGAKSYTAKKLKTGKRYYFKVRAYKVVDGKKIYSGWSVIKSAKAK